MFNQLPLKFGGLMPERKKIVLVCEETFFFSVLLYVWILNCVFLPPLRIENYVNVPVVRCVSKQMDIFGYSTVTLFYDSTVTKFKNNT